MPRATRRKISVSRGVREAIRGSTCPLAVAPLGSWPANISSIRRVIRGETTASPLATVRIASISSAGRVSLSKNPLAPARSPPKAYSSRSKVVKMSTLVSRVRVISAVASIPLTPGIRISISTTSGLSALAWVIAAAPSAASPTTSISASASSTIRKPIRISAWSSAKSTRIIPAAAI